MLKHLIVTLKLTFLTLLFCSVVYPAIVWGIAQICVPNAANGHLIKNAAGVVLGSRQVAQKFTSARYFHPRPSSVDYNAAGAGGSNLSPASLALRKKGEERILTNGATKDRPLPVDLATASGSGLDPHISLASARFQIPRIAKARTLAPEKIEKLLMEHLSYPGGFLLREPLINVLEINIQLDQLK